MKFQLESFAEEQYSTVARTNYHVRASCVPNLKIHSHDVVDSSPTTTPTSTNKGLKRCASNLSAERHIQWSNNIESSGMGDDALAVDVRTTPPLSQEIYDSPMGQKCAVSSTPCSTFTTSERNFCIDIIPDPSSTQVQIPLLRYESSTSHRRRLFPPQQTHGHQMTTIDQGCTTNMMHPFPMKTSRCLENPFPQHECTQYPAIVVSRPRSKSIAIKQSQCYEEFENFDNSTERIYDWATWRMYHRITSARRSRASVVPIINKVPAPTVVARHPSFAVPEGATPEMSLATMDYSQDGEVFEIEDI